MLVPADHRAGHDGYIDRNRKSGRDELVGSSRRLPLNRKDGSEAQLHEAERVAQTTVEMVASIESAAGTADISERSARDAEASGETMARAMEALERISGEIKVIDDITRQTDLLAPNAGPAGRGFAVVAKEVRSLAENSRSAAAGIQTLSGETEGLVAGTDELRRTLDGLRSGQAHGAPPTDRGRRPSAPASPTACSGPVLVAGNA